MSQAEKTKRTRLSGHGAECNRHVSSIQETNSGWLGGEVMEENGLEAYDKGLGCYIEDLRTYSGPADSGSTGVTNFFFLSILHSTNNYALQFYELNTL